MNKCILRNQCLEGDFDTSFMQVNGDKTKLKHNKTAFKVQVLSPTDRISPSPSPPPSAHSSGLQVPTNAAQTRSTHTNTLRSRYFLKMISPRSSNYERLEGGMGPSRISQFRWFGWRKFGIVACVLIVLVYLFGPRQKRWSPHEKQPG